MKKGNYYLNCKRKLRHADGSLTYEWDEKPVQMRGYSFPVDIAGGDRRMMVVARGGAYNVKDWALFDLASGVIIRHYPDCTRLDVVEYAKRLMCKYTNEQLNQFADEFAAMYKEQTGVPMKTNRVAELV